MSEKMQTDTRAASHHRRARAALIAGCLVTSWWAMNAAAQTPAAPDHSIGLVLGTWRFALYETEAKEECPEGFQFRHIDNYKAEYPTPEAQKLREEQVGYYTNRGPHGENVFYFPTVLKDQLPFRAARGKTSYGLNLDDETEGRGNAFSMPHENLVSPDGERGIDNQMYRVLGCVPGLRKRGIAEGSIPQLVLSEYQARLLLEVTDVDDERNDDEVTVTTYRGMDPVVMDASGELIPWLSQRIDHEQKRFMYRTRGRIVDGVLMTDPVDVRLPAVELKGIVADRRLQGMRLRLKLTPTGAEGLLGGYADIEHWYLTYAKTWGAHVLADMVGWSGPATYDALYRFADYRDPASGKPTAISTAYQVKFARAFIVHSAQSDAAIHAALEGGRNSFAVTGKALVVKSAHGRAASPEPVPRGVRIEQTDEMGPVFADTRGHTLYTWLGDKKPGESLCNDERYTDAVAAAEVHYFLPDADRRATCREVWPPFIAKQDSKPLGRWSVITRKDGTRQWAFDQQPLYAFAQDTRPGEVNGIDRVLDQRTPLWVPLDAPPGLVARQSLLGRVLSTVDGKTLYAHEAETLARQTCLADCLKTWLPVPAPAASSGAGIDGWSIVQRADGSKQWAYAGKPLYTFVGDARFGDLNGAAEKHWQAAALQGRLKPPPGITLQMTADGEVFADRNGMTLYRWHCVEDATDHLYCDTPGTTSAYWRSLCGTPEECTATWKPLVAPKDAKPVGRLWSIVKIDPTGKTQYAAPGDPEGLRVWAYGGRPLYTFAKDREPGDMDGHNVRVFYLWGYTMLRADGQGARLQ
jgi:predicted lipoprotein with Yx(FWY)xxD motif